MSSAVDTGAMVSGAAKVVVIALGNRFRGDDGIGPIVAERLKNNVADRPGGRVDGCTIVEGKDDAMALVSAWENAALAVVIDAAVDTAWINENFPDAAALKNKDGIVDPNDLAENYVMLHEQARNAWTFELDVRPWIERW